MSFLLLQILVCLLIAAFIGAIIGWLLRGNCSKKIKEIEEECEMKMRSIEREWNTKLNYPEEYDNSLDVETDIHADLKNKLQDEIDMTQDISTHTQSSSNHNTALSGAVASVLGATGLQAASSNRLEFDEIKNLLNKKGIELSDEKIKLYDSFDVDFEKSEDLEENYDIKTIVGINSKYAKRFKDLGIYTTTDLVKKLHNNYEDIDFVAKKLKVQPEDVTSWISMADIIRLPGLSAKEAQLIQTVGISSARELGVVNIHSLHTEIEELNKKLSIVNEVPDIPSIELWSKVAKLLG